MKLVHFKDHTDIVRNMLKALAPDEVWMQISWQETPNKRSFVKDFDSINKAIQKISFETFPSECTTSYCQSRFKVFFRHTSERIQRKSEKPSLTNFNETR